MNFKELNIIPPILKALEKENYEVPTPIQEQAITPILEGRDVLGCAQTGTGKTAAFAVPILQILSDKPTIKTGKREIAALILTPTRELAVQIFESFRTYGQYTKLRYGVLFGGVSQKPQELMLQKGVDILVATPGRLNDLINQGLVDLKNVKIFILDEADRMLDMGFIVDVRKVVKRMPPKKQTLLFSATMPPEIAKIVNDVLVNPVKISVAPVSSAVDTVEQFIYYVDKKNKIKLLLDVLKDPEVTSALVFTRTKHGADKVVQELVRAKISAEAIHGNKSQNARQLALNNFKSKITRVLVATDIAARGIDINELSHVVNYELPNVPETYIHRIGRTGRAGLGGIAIAFCNFDEKPYAKAIEKLMGREITEIKEHAYPMLINTPSPKPVNNRRRPATQKPAERRPEHGRRVTGTAKKENSRYKRG